MWTCLLVTLVFLRKKKHHDLRISKRRSYGELTREGEVWVGEEREEIGGWQKGWKVAVPSWGWHPVVHCRWDKQHGWVYVSSNSVQPLELSVVQKSIGLNLGWEERKKVAEIKCREMTKGIDRSSMMFQTSAVSLGSCWQEREKNSEWDSGNWLWTGCSHWS